VDNKTVIEKFLKHKQACNNSKREEGISKKSLHLYQVSLEYLAADLKKPFKQATEDDILSHLEKYKQRTKNRHIILFRDFYRWLYNLDEGEKLPDCIRKIKPRTIDIDDMKYAEKIITPEEYHLLLDHCNKPMQKAILEALWSFGARKEEIEMMRVGDVSYDGKDTKAVLRVSKTETREVIIENRAEHLLKWVESLCPYYGQKDKPLFVVKWGGEYKQIGLNYAWDLLDDLCTKAKMRHIKPHDFRHTCTTNHLKNGTPETHIKTLMGWKKNSNMLRVYDHNKIKDYKEWLDRKRSQTKPTYELLAKQKEELETSHEKQLQALNERLKRNEDSMSQLLEAIEFNKEELVNLVRNKAIGAAQTVLKNPEKH
jgi:site-specific recombinase XerD